MGRKSPRGRYSGSTCCRRRLLAARPRQRPGRADLLLAGPDRLRPLLAAGSTLVLAPDTLLADEQGDRYIAWELRGGRVCIEPASAAGGRPPSGIRFFVTSGPSTRAPFSRLTFRRQAGPYAVWERRGVVGGPSPCPLIAVRQARQGRWHFPR